MTHYKKTFLGYLARLFRDKNNQELADSKAFLIICLLILPAYPTFALIYHYLGFHLVEKYVWAGLVISSISLFSFLLTRSTAAGTHLLALGAFVTLIPSSLQIGGIDAPGVLWIPAAQTLTTFLFNRKIALSWSFVFILGAIAIAYPNPFGLQVFHPEYPETAIKLFCLLGSSSVILIIGFSYRHYQKQLQDLIQTHNQELARMVEENSRLVRVLSHDVGNAISIISGSSKVIRRESTSELSSVVTSKLDRIDRGVENISALISQVRDQQAIALGKKKIQLQSVNLFRCIEESCFLLKDAIDAKNLTLHIQTRLPERETNVLAEPVSCTNIILNNLLSNAVKFSNQNSKISFEVFQDPVDPAKIVLVLSDEGIGIPPALLERLFDISATTSRTGTNGEKGTGFGMPLVRSYMRLYGGDIVVTSRTESNPDHPNGTQVRLCFRKA